MVWPFLKKNTKTLPLPSTAIGSETSFTTRLEPLPSPNFVQVLFFLHRFLDTKEFFNSINRVKDGIKDSKETTGVTETEPLGPHSLRVHPKTSRSASKKRYG